MKIKKIFKNLINYLRKYGTLLIIGVIIVVMLAGNLFILLENKETLDMMFRRVELESYVTRQKFLDTLRTIENLTKITSQNSITQFKFIQSIIEIQKTLTKEINQLKPLDLKIYDKIKEANLKIVNETYGVIGSGVRIKIKNKHYVLTCAHLIKRDNDRLVACWDNRERFPLILEKYDRWFDLALFRVEKAKPGRYLEISKTAPAPGSDLIIIENPAGAEDIITNGILCKVVNRNRYMFTNIIFFGSSGGPVLYKNKVVGIVSTIQTLNNGGVSVHYGYASGLKNINRFLEEYYE